MATQSPAPVWRPAHKAILAGLLTVQFAVAYFIGSEHLLTNDLASLIPPIGITAVLPVALFLAVYGFSVRFRRFVLAQDLRTLTMMQLWRVVGFAFLPLYAFDLLPGLFAWPAGLGDLAIGLAAVVIVARMDRDPDYALSSGSRRFQRRGLFDFAVAIGTSGLAAGAIPALIPGGITSAPLDVWPLNIFPSFIVPAFIILQLSALLKVRALRRQAASRPLGALKAA